MVPRAENEVALAWVAGALERCYSPGQAALAGHLEAVLEEVLWELTVFDGRPEGRDRDP